MKFNPQNYRRDLLVSIMRSHAQLNDEEKFRKVRGMKNGIFFEMNTGSKWVKKMMDSKTVDHIIGELYESH